MPEAHTETAEKQTDATVPATPVDDVQKAREVWAVFLGSIQDICWKTQQRWEAVQEAEREDGRLKDECDELSSVGRKLVDQRRKQIQSGLNDRKTIREYRELQTEWLTKAMSSIDDLQQNPEIPWNLFSLFKELRQVLQSELFVYNENPAFFGCAESTIASIQVLQTDIQATDIPADATQAVRTKETLMKALGKLIECMKTLDSRRSTRQEGREKRARTRGNIEQNAHDIAEAQIRLVEMATFIERQKGLFAKQVKTLLHEVWNAVRVLQPLVNAPSSADAMIIEDLRTMYEQLQQDHEHDTPALLQKISDVTTAALFALDRGLTTAEPRRKQPEEPPRRDTVAKRPAATREILNVTREPILTIGTRWKLTFDPRVSIIEQEGSAHPRTDAEFQHLFNRKNHLKVLGECQPTENAIKKIAHRLWERRGGASQPHDSNQAQRDWEEAVQLCAPGALASFMIYEYEKEKGRLTVHDFVVKPLLRELGVGTQMLNFLCSKVKNELYVEIIWVVRETELPLLHFLSSRGFVAESIETGYFEDTGEDGYKMRYALK